MTRACHGLHGKLQHLRLESQSVRSPPQRPQSQPCRTEYAASFRGSCRPVHRPSFRRRRHAARPVTLFPIATLCAGRSDIYQQHATLWRQTNRCWSASRWFILRRRACLSARYKSAVTIILCVQNTQHRELSTQNSVQWRAKRRLHCDLQIRIPDRMEQDIDNGKW